MVELLYINPQLHIKITFQINVDNWKFSFAITGMNSILEYTDIESSKFWLQ